MLLYVCLCVCLVCLCQCACKAEKEEEFFDESARKQTQQPWCITLLFQLPLYNDTLKWDFLMGRKPMWWNQTDGFAAGFRFIIMIIKIILYVFNHHMFQSTKAGTHPLCLSIMGLVSFKNGHLSCVQCSFVLLLTKQQMVNRACWWRRGGKISLNATILEKRTHLCLRALKSW